MTFTVDLQRAPDGTTVVAGVRNFELTIGSKSGDFSVGFNPMETVLSAAGACITASLGLVAGNSGVDIDDLRIRVTGTRQADPPRIQAMHIELEIDSPASDEKLDTLVRIAQRNSTVVSTLAQAVDLTLTWKRGPANSQ